MSWPRLHQAFSETIAVHDVMIVLEGRLSISTDGDTVTVGPGEIVDMPKGEAVTIGSHEEGAMTAYVTYPHWRTAKGQAGSPDIIAVALEDS